MNIMQSICINAQQNRRDDIEIYGNCKSNRAIVALINIPVVLKDAVY